MRNHCIIIARALSPMCVDTRSFSPLLKKNFVEFAAPALLLLLLSLIYAGTILGRIIAKHGKQNYYYYHYVVVGIIFILLSFFSYERHIFEHYGNKFRIRDDIVATMG